MDVLLLILLFVLLFFLFLSLILLVVGPAMLLQPYRRTIDFYRRSTTLLHPSGLPYPFEEVALTTPEGIVLSCWLIKPTVAPRATVVYLHGVSESKIAGLPTAEFLCARGFNVFLYDARRHGESGGKFCTYGFYEKHDCSMVISYLLDRPDVNVGKVGLIGTSMGAAVALQAAAIDRRVAAVVAESGFAHLRSVFDDYQKRMIVIPFHFLRNIVIKRSETMAHFRANDVVPILAVRQIRVPLLIIHGTADRTIRSEYSRRLYEQANPPKELWLIEGATHSDVSHVGGEAYRRRVTEFFERALA